MKLIQEYPLSLHENQEILLPFGAKILDIVYTANNMGVKLLAEIDTDRPLWNTDIFMKAETNELDFENTSRDNLTYIKTVYCNIGNRWIPCHFFKMKDTTDNDLDLPLAAKLEAAMSSGGTDVEY